MKKALTIVLLLSLSIFLQAQSASDKLIREGVNLHDQEKYMEALSHYQQALKLNPASLSAVYEMSLSYLKLNDYDNAILYSNQVINVGFKPLLVDAYVVKGTALAAQNKVDEAISLFRDAMAIHGEHYLLHYNLGLSYYNKGSNNLALIQLRKAIEKDTTHPEAFLLYAYVLNDAGKWVQSFYSFHFFLLLEPNTKRSAVAFKEMYKLVDQVSDANAPRLQPEDGIDRSTLYRVIQEQKPKQMNRAGEYKFFVAASQEVFYMLSLLQQPSYKNVLWEFFVPIYQEILESQHFNTYCRYISVAFFPESLQWWEANKKEVDNFIEWFEQGKSPDMEEDAYFEGEE